MGFESRLWDPDVHGAWREGRTRVRAEQGRFHTGLPWEREHGERQEVGFGAESGRLALPCLPFPGATPSP